MLDLKAKKREKLGTIISRKIRADGLIPAELYGHGITNLHLSVPLKDFLKVFKETGESTLINLDIDGEKRPILIFDIKTDPVKGEIIHADFYQVRLDEKLKAHVMIVLEGVSAGVKEKAGILTHAMREVEVEALPADLPHDIKADISGLDDIGKSIYVRDLPQIKGIRYMADPETVVASVTLQAEEEIESGLASVDEVEVVGEKEKKAKEEEGGEGVASEATEKKADKK